MWIELSPARQARHEPLAPSTASRAGLPAHCLLCRAMRLGLVVCLPLGAALDRPARGRLQEADRGLPLGETRLWSPRRRECSVLRSTWSAPWDRDPYGPRPAAPVTRPPLASRSGARGRGSSNPSSDDGAVRGLGPGRGRSGREAPKDGVRHRAPWGTSAACPFAAGLRAEADEDLRAGCPPTFNPSGDRPATRANPLQTRHHDGGHTEQIAAPFPPLTAR